MVKRQWLSEMPPPPAAVQAEAPASDSPSPPGADEPIVLSGILAMAWDRVAQVAATFELEANLIPSAASQLALRLVHPHDGELALCIEPARPDGRYFERRGGVGFWYERTRFGSDSAPAWLDALMEQVGTTLDSEDLLPLAAELAAKPESSPSLASSQTSRPTPPEEAPPAVDPTRPYARARVLGPEDVERFFHVDYVYQEGTHVDQPPTSRIGVIYQCNQPCTFCQLAEMNTHIPPARIYAALDASRARGAVRVILTGGEPTLCRHLPDYIAYARDHGFTTIELQTNATLLDKPDLARRLRAAGLTDAQVSLHGPDAEISDRLTGAPGTHRRTLEGIGNLLETGVRVLLNHLIFRDNCHLLLDFVDLVERRWGRYRERVIIQFHTPLNEFAQLDSARRHIARYTEYAPLLQKAIDRARARGYIFKDLQDPTGIPALCVLGHDSEYLGPVLSQRVRPRLHRWESEWMTRVEACQTCDLADACMGIPRVYIDLHGPEEFRPIHLAAPRPTPATPSLEG